MLVQKRSIQGNTVRVIPLYLLLELLDLPLVLYVPGVRLFRNRRLRALLPVEPVGELGPVLKVLEQLVLYRARYTLSANRSRPSHKVLVRTT